MAPACAPLSHFGDRYVSLITDFSSILHLSSFQTLLYHVSSPRTISSIPQ